MLLFRITTADILTAFNIEWMIWMTDYKVDTIMEYSNDQYPHVHSYFSKMEERQAYKLAEIGPDYRNQSMLR